MTRLIYWQRIAYQTQRKHQSKKFISSKTIYNQYGTLKSFFRWDTVHGFSAENPMIGIPKPKIAAPFK